MPLAAYTWTYSGDSVNPGPPQAALVQSWLPGQTPSMVPDPDAIDLSALDQPLNPGDLVTGMTSADGSVQYAYDAQGELTGATYSGYPTSVANESYSYDANGNPANSGDAIGPGNELLSDGTYNYQYDADGNCIERTNIATGAVTDYTWDNRNRLIAVTDRASAAGPATEVVDLIYDVENRWIGETVNPEHGQPLQTTHFAYDGNQIVLQFQGSGAGALTASNLSDRYTWGPAVDQLLSDEKVTSVHQPGNVLWALTDNQGTVRDLAQFNAQTGVTSVVDHRVFNSFGYMVSQSNPAVSELFAYDGRPYDQYTGALENNLNRWYVAYAGRWLSEDPDGFTAGDTNLYCYCGNSPTNATDPGGLDGQGSGDASTASQTQGAGVQGPGADFVKKLGLSPSVAYTVENQDHGSLLLIPVSAADARRLFPPGVVDSLVRRRVIPQGVSPGGVPYYYGDYVYQSCTGCHTLVNSGSDVVSCPDVPTVLAFRNASIRIYQVMSLVYTAMVGYSFGSQVLGPLMQSAIPATLVLDTTAGALTFHVVGAVTINSEVVGVAVAGTSIILVAAVTPLGPGGTGGGATPASPHSVEWQLQGPRGGEIASGEETSGVDFSLPKGTKLSFPDQSWYGHTEGKIISELWQNGQLGAGRVLSMEGKLPPCSQCMNALKWASEKFQMTITYVDGTGNWWTWINGVLK